MRPTCFLRARGRYAALGSDLQLLHTFCLLEMDYIPCASETGLSLHVIDEASTTPVNARPSLSSRSISASERLALADEDGHARGSGVASVEREAERKEAEARTKAATNARREAKAAADKNKELAALEDKKAADLRRAHEERKERARDRKSVV